MKHCELVPGRGIRHGDIDIFFGSKRTELRKALGDPKPQTADISWDDEDEYEVDTAEWLRLRYLDGKLCDIEVLGGELVHDGIELKNTDIRTLKDKLHNCGIVIDDESQWLTDGRDCIDLQIVVATLNDVGEAGEPGDEMGNGIAWIIASSGFEVEDA